MDNFTLPVSFNEKQYDEILAHQGVEGLLGEYCIQFFRTQGNKPGITIDARRRISVVRSRLNDILSKPEQLTLLACIGSGKLNKEIILSGKSVMDILKMN